MPAAPLPDRQLDIRLGENSELGDLGSLLGDLLIAQMAAHHMADPVIATGEYLYLRRACWEGAIIAYGRCFASGQGVGGSSRLTLDGYLRHLSDAQRASHADIIRLRNKRIGHLVAEESGQVVTVFVGVNSVATANTDGTHVDLGDLYLHVETELYDADLAADLGGITQILRGKVGERIDELRFELNDRLTNDAAGVGVAIADGSSWPLGAS